MYIISTPPASEPLTLTECKLHLRVDGTDEDTLITTYLQSAREQVELMTNRAMMPQTVKQYLDTFPTCTIDLRFAPIASVTSVKYYDSDNVEQTLVLDTDYQVDTVTEPARIVPLLSWPVTKAKANAVTIEYVAGYADADTVPANIKAAILLLVGEMYEIRENYVKRLPTAVDYLLSPMKVFI